MKYSGGLLLLIISLVPVSSRQVLPAHSHNDYEHSAPLSLALEHRFKSVEADVWLIDGVLRVSHSRPLLPSRCPTFESLYMAPLRSVILLNNGTIYPGYDGEFFLMIDVKGPAEATAKELSLLISSYPDVREAVTFVVSGNRSIDFILGQEDPVLTMDGRLDQLGQAIEAEVMPLISDHFRTYFHWKDGDLPAWDRQRLQAIVEEVHSQGKLLRLWAAPDNPDCWDLLLDHGVDLINTDRIEAFSEWMNHR